MAGLSQHGARTAAQNDREQFPVGKHIHLKVATLGRQHTLLARDWYGHGCTSPVLPRLN